MHPQRITLLILAILGTLTTFMPWADISFYGIIDGTKGIGWITFVLFLGVIVITFVGNRKSLLENSLKYAVFILCGVAFGIGLYEIFNLQKVANELINNNPIAKAFGMKVSVQYGLYALLAISFFTPAIFLIFKEKSDTVA